MNCFFVDYNYFLRIYNFCVFLAFLLKILCLVESCILKKELSRLENYAEFHLKIIKAKVKALLLYFNKCLSLLEVWK